MRPILRQGEYDRRQLRGGLLATEGDKSPIVFFEGNLTGANFEKASLSTTGDDYGGYAPIVFSGGILTGANFEEAARDEGDEGDIVFVVVCTAPTSRRPRSRRRATTPTSASRRRP